MKRDQLIERALHLYRCGVAVTAIAETCNVNRCTIHRWVNSVNASRDDYKKAEDAQYEAIKEKSLSQFTVEEQLKSYVLDMAMAHVTKALPNLQVKNVNDLWKLHKIVTNSLA